MFNIAEYRQSSDRLVDLLPWAALVANGVVLNKDGSFQRTLRFRGPDLESATEPQLVAAAARLNNALKRFLQGLDVPANPGGSTVGAVGGVAAVIELGQKTF